MVSVNSLVRMLGTCLCFNIIVQAALAPAAPDVTSSVSTDGYGFPSCVVTCFQDYLSQDGCHVTDFSCHCSRITNLVVAIEPCMAQQCANSDAKGFSDSFSSVCQSAPVPTAPIAVASANNVLGTSSIPAVPMVTTPSSAATPFSVTTTVLLTMAVPTAVVSSVVTDDTGASLSVTAITTATEVPFTITLLPVESSTPTPDTPSTILAQVVSTITLQPIVTSIPQFSVITANPTAAPISTATITLELSTFTDTATPISISSGASITSSGVIPSSSVSDFSTSTSVPSNFTVSATGSGVTFSPPIATGAAATAAVGQKMQNIVGLEIILALLAVLA